MELGRKVRDIISGFEGITTGYVNYISGCNQVLVSPTVDKDGKRRESEWFDEQRMVMIDETIIKLNNTGGNGFDREAPKR